eukprot:6485913-Amphidinium_carterae.1
MHVRNTVATKQDKARALLRSALEFLEAHEIEICYVDGNQLICTHMSSERGRHRPYSMYSQLQSGSGRARIPASLAGH